MLKKIKKKKIKMKYINALKIECNKQMQTNAFALNRKST